MLRKALQTKNFFAAHVLVGQKTILAGMVLTTRQPGEILTLKDRDDDDFSITIEVPKLTDYYRQEIRIHDETNETAG